MASSILVGGCGLLPIDRNVAAFCAETADVKDLVFTQEEDDSFWNAVRAAAGQSGTVAMADVVAASGWNDTWDVMVKASAGVEPDRLNRLGGATDLCWTGLPRFAGDGPAHGVHVFFRAGQPIRAVEWDWRTQLFMIPGDVDQVLRPATEMAPTEYNWLQPA
ncbi:hypothetical protein [Rhodococcus sp. NPDC049939]|uniref:hypothetical protein n=1 Tax=Rhodococcus sp. NPDC049939 TaxID=3155511 RepID=UPI0033C91F7D